MYVTPVEPADLSPALRGFYDDASPGGKRFIQATAHAGEHAERFFPYYVGLRFGTRIGIRLCELLRLAIAQTTQCPNCLAGRVEAAGLTEDLIARLGERDTTGLTEREAAVVDFAFRFGADHFSLGEADLRRLHELFDEQEVVEIGMLCAQFLGFGRMAMVFGLETPTCPIPVRPVVEQKG
ncbi:alkylhydroperoxidase AhpD family core domain-containing protein [Pseudonocardia thermophila]|jgi:Uncharacterized conserved protein|uniref:Alkylhydroperoxidase AhpD family core domain-containing protein n=1 Tax=Pseudonocardia thermophila TaxID=1848 RepID=A0A1M6XJ62_PSETH|nr:hypothetical protein [Pseudonocardia thermophila]SHL05899.1 alkylhydroperoxidase AhpD family core domain-containing protein [Pseudonocardia thermophila]